MDMSLRYRTESISIRHRLRNSTSALHARVDQAIGQCLLQGAEGYVRLLQASASAVLPLERALMESNVTSLMLDWHQRSRSMALQSDLAALSTAVPTGLTPPSSAQLQDEAYQFGVLYVLEGSRLGARVILQALRNGPANVHQNALSYLSHGQGEPLWPTFVAQLEASDAARSDPATVVAGATAAFQMFLPTAD